MMQGHVLGHETVLQHQKVTHCDDGESRGKQAAMKGQWIGNYTGSSAGMIIANVDERLQHFEGVIYLLDADNCIPGTAVKFKTNNKDHDFQFSTNQIRPINPISGLPEVWENVQRLYAYNVTVAQSLDAQGSWNSDSLALSWTTDIGVSGNCTLPRSKADQPSELVPLEQEWESFKEYVNSLEGRRHLFRGQSKPWRLRTSFHRAGRANLMRFLDEDIPSLQRHLSARTKHIFNLGVPDEYGAFFNLV